MFTRPGVLRSSTSFATWLTHLSPIFCLISTLKPIVDRSASPANGHPRYINMTVIKGRSFFHTLFSMSFESSLTFARIDKTNGTSIFRLVGPLTIRNLFEIQAALRSSPLPRVTVVDLTQVPYMDSAGMGVIVNSYVHAINHGAEFFVAGVCERVNSLFELTRVDKLIPVCDPADEV